MATVEKIQQGATLKKVTNLVDLGRIYHWDINDTPYTWKYVPEVKEEPIVKNEDYDFLKNLGKNNDEEKKKKDHWWELTPEEIEAGLAEEDRIRKGNRIPLTTYEIDYNEPDEKREKELKKRPFIKVPGYDINGNKINENRKVKKYN